MLRIASRIEFLESMTQPSPLISETPRLSVVVPVRNEAGNVLPLIEEIERACESLLPLEIVYIDDGSSDGTLKELLRAKESRPWLKIVKHAESCGQSAAVRSGVRLASAPLVATLDGDGQNDPAFYFDRTKPGQHRHDHLRG